VINISLEQDQVIREVNQQFFVGTALAETSGARDDSLGLLNTSLCGYIHHSNELSNCAV
jgi:hypothetical protein